MTTAQLIQIVLFFAVVILGGIPLGLYMAKVYEGGSNVFIRILRPLEVGFYKIAGIKEDQEQHWTTYALALLMFNVIGMLFMYGVMRLQAVLPDALAAIVNPAGQSAVAPDLAFNTAASFTTNTNWQSYGGETTMSYLTQMLGMTVHNFTSAATGMAVLIALVRAFTRASTKTIGNFYVDAVRSVVYILLPMAVVFALFLLWQGVPENFDPYTTATTLEGGKQMIAQGPVASQQAIMMLGSNGGGFFNVNAAHPFENPTPLSSFFQMVATIFIAAGIVVTFGKMIRDKRQGRALLIVMSLMLAVGILFTTYFESHGNPLLSAIGVDQTVSDTAPGGNMEGKEVRFGIVNSAIWAEATTGASNGSVISMHDSFTPLGGMMPLINLMLNEVVFGGVGSGLHGMIVDVILAVFIAGLMVGRTPEYLGKKMESREVKLAVLCLMIFPLVILAFGGLAVLLPIALPSIAANGPHGLTEALYAYASATANNGSAFGGFTVMPTGNLPTGYYQNSMLGTAMLIGRFLVIIPTLAIAGAVAAKKTVPVSAGTFPTHGGLFIGLLIGVIIIVGGLTFFPVLALGPIVEHLAMLAGTTF